MLTLVVGDGSADVQAQHRNRGVGGTSIFTPSICEHLFRPYLTQFEYLFTNAYFQKRFWAAVKTAFFTVCTAPSSSMQCPLISRQLSRIECNLISAAGFAYYSEIDTV